MKIPYYGFEKCILCINNEANTWEHLIPEFIGGELKVKMLCKDCNCNFGSKLVKTIKTDPSIRLDVNHLKNDISQIHNRVENDQIYLGKDENNKLIKLKYKTGEFKKVGIQDSKEAREIRQNLEGKFLDEKVVALMAYEFLVCLEGKLIYDSKFDFIRKFILESTLDKNISIEKLTTRNYRPFHQIYPEFFEVGLNVSIVLFGWYFYRVSFKNLNLSNKNFIGICEDLKNKRTLFALSEDDMKKGVYKKDVIFN